MYPGTCTHTHTYTRTPPTPQEACFLLLHPRILKLYQIARSFALLCPGRALWSSVFAPCGHPSSFLDGSFHMSSRDLSLLPWAVGKGSSSLDFFAVTDCYSREPIQVTFLLPAFMSKKLLVISSENRVKRCAVARVSTQQWTPWTGLRSKIKRLQPWEVSKVADVWKCLIGKHTLLRRLRKGRASFVTPFWNWFLHRHHDKVLFLFSTYMC